MRAAACAAKPSCRRHACGVTAADAARPAFEGTKVKPSSLGMMRARRLCVAPAGTRPWQSEDTRVSHRRHRTRLRALQPDELREIATTRDRAQALVGRERPGWDVADIVEINDESGPSFEVAIRKGGDQRTLLVSEDEQIVAER